MRQAATIRNAYISVEIAKSGLQDLSAGLKDHFNQSGIDCDILSTDSHVSIAYGEGEVEIEALDRVASEIADLAFSLRVDRFELYSGLTTPFDYLVVNLKSDRCFEDALTVAQGCMKTKSFEGGFRSHVSLLKFPKGSVSLEWAERIVGEMNTCQAAAQALGRRVSLQGEMVSVFTAERECCVTKRFSANVSRGSHQVKTDVSAA